tara:strand:- start:428 stop:1693 length:1266 start_codon:yes stop_codon:yes gene_type:complete
MFKHYKISVIGLGYVGLPLATALSNSYSVIGFDINKERVKEISLNNDKTGEVDASTLYSSSLMVTENSDKIKDSDIYIITVPTPIDSKNIPDLSAVFDASRLVGASMKKGSIVVYESTVYPGVTEEECGPLLQDVSGLICGKDFWLGYSPERINPGDKKHTIDKITKVISGQTEKVTAILREVYGSINNGNIFIAANIRTAEAAKVIENAQRDINIAFVNEVSLIFDRIGISTLDVLNAANTKWNFIDFKPGLVGGHCIGVDPYYLAYKAQLEGVNPEVILAGRRINDNMGNFYAKKLSENLQAGDNVLILGVTFKENVPDIRNTKVLDIINTLESSGINVDIHDPLADPDEVFSSLNRNLISIAKTKKYKALVLAVNHKDFYSIEEKKYKELVMEGGIILDLKGVMRNKNVPNGLRLISI